MPHTTSPTSATANEVQHNGHSVSAKAIEKKEVKVPGTPLSCTFCSINYTKNKCVGCERSSWK